MFIFLGACTIVFAIFLFMLANKYLWEWWGFLIFMAAILIGIAGFFIPFIPEMQKEDAQENAYIYGCQKVHGHYVVIGHEYAGKNSIKIYGCVK